MSTPPTARTAPGEALWTPPVGPFREFEASAFLGSDDALWTRACEDVLHWRVKTRSGFSVEPADRVVTGARPTIVVAIGGLRIREPVEVVDVVLLPDRVGFAYRTLPGHPVDGEEAFILSRECGQITLTLRSLTRPARSPGWWLLYPALRVAQVVVRRRYLRSLC